MTEDELKMQHRILIDAVKYMRAQQILYFKTRSKTVLAESKRAEAAVDKLLSNQSTLNL